MRNKIKRILKHSSSDGGGAGLIEHDANRLVKLFKKEILKIIGEDEKESSFVSFCPTPQAIRITSRNKLRVSQRKKAEKIK